MDTCRFDYKLYKGICYGFKPNEYLKEFQSIFVNGGYFYIRRPELSDIRIIDLTGWGSELTSQHSLPNLKTPWHVKDDGLYGVQVSQIVEIIKYPLDGKSLLWRSEFLYCETKDPKNEIFFAVKDFKVFVICTPVNLITIYNSEDGKIISRYAIDKGNVVSMECSPSFLFILYGDGNVVQYTLDLHYVHTYRVDNMKTPEYNMLRVDDKYMFYVLCRNTAGYDGCFIYQWSVQTNLTKFITLHYNEKLKRQPDITIQREESLMVKRKFLKFDVSNYEFSIKNSFFTPVTYKGSTNQQNLTFLSGRGVVSKGVCVDLFLHDMIMKEKGGEFYIDGDSKRKITGIDSPLSDYAALLLTEDDKYFYLIHGGMSCDYQTIYADLFVIDILANEYIKLSQNTEFA
jgi:hypothetical protein